MSKHGDDEHSRAEGRKPRNRQRKQDRKAVLHPTAIPNAGEHSSMDEFFLTEPILFQPLTAEDLRILKEKTG